MNFTTKLAILIVLGAFVYEASAACVHGTAKTCGGCDCQKNSTTGYWMGANCDACLYNFFGSACKTYCKASDTCSGRGTCNTTDGSCICGNGFTGPHCTQERKLVTFTSTVVYNGRCSDVPAQQIITNGTNDGFNVTCEETTSKRALSTRAITTIFTFTRTIPAELFALKPINIQITSYFDGAGVLNLIVTITTEKDFQNYGNGVQTRSLRAGRTILPAVDLAAPQESTKEQESGWTEQQLQEFQF